jgi:uncharacterized protein with ParB-like and HNH nuclease domain
MESRMQYVSDHIFFLNRRNELYDISNQCSDNFNIEYVFNYEIPTSTSNITLSSIHNIYRNKIIYSKLNFEIDDMQQQHIRGSYHTITITPTTDLRAHG